MPLVCIDSSPLLVRSAGVKTYLYHWLRALQAADPGGIRPYLAPARGELKGELNSELNHDGGPRLHFPQLAALSILNRTGGILADVAAPKCDVFHISNLLHYPPKQPKLSATIHDLTPWTVPECHTATALKSEKAYASRVFMRADGLIADSENTRQDAIRILRIKPGKIRVIHLGVPKAYFSATSPPSTSPCKPYFLFVGTVEPRKNVDLLLSAWASLPAGFRGEHRLMIAGMKGWNSDATMRRMAQMAKEDGSLTYLGYVPEADMPSLVAGALALVYPSLYEGFGLPVAQAMAAGCPVIASNVSSLPEVAGDAALFVDPRSVGELTEAMRRLAGSPALCGTLRLRGLVRAKSFTWERAAAESLRYFTDLAATTAATTGG